MVDRMIEAFSPASVKQTYFRYFPDGWKEVSREACADAAYYDHRKNIPNPKGVAAAEAVACIEITTFG